MKPIASPIVLALAFAALQPARAADWKMAPAGSESCTTTLLTGPPAVSVKQRGGLPG